MVDNFTYMEHNAFIEVSFKGVSAMRVAVIGSRNINVDISKYIPPEMTELISGGAVGVDTLAERYADGHMIPKLIIRPDYARYGRYAPLKRNEMIVEASDLIVAVWDGKSRGTRYTMDYANRLGKRLVVHRVR